MRKRHSLAAISRPATAGNATTALIALLHSGTTQGFAFLTFWNIDFLRCVATPPRQGSGNEVPAITPPPILASRPPQAIFPLRTPVSAPASVAPHPDTLPRPTFAPPPLNSPDLRFTRPPPPGFARDPARDDDQWIAPQKVVITVATCSTRGSRFTGRYRTKIFSRYSHRLAQSAHNEVSRPRLLCVIRPPIHFFSSRRKSIAGPSLGARVRRSISVFGRVFCIATKLKYIGTSRQISERLANCVLLLFA